MPGPASLYLTPQFERLVISIDFQCGPERLFALSTFRSVVDVVPDIDDELFEAFDLIVEGCVFRREDSGL